MMVFQRNYNVSRDEILNDYTWSDIQTYINNLPREKVITVYQSEKADNQKRYLEMLCEHNEQDAFDQLERAEKEFLEKMNLEEHEKKR